jgi:hypothetical protein
VAISVPIQTFFAPLFPVYQQIAASAFAMGQGNQPHLPLLGLHLIPIGGNVPTPGFADRF